ncbi:hypothetical protein [Alcanivorax sp.]|uniref:hypothetical protein n=1 Tax=Alcanivorax sp. TaxID=1872427 RepID=UPI0025BA179B|nr:hypothetical protein [Alcanivorax sp.]
MPLKVRQSGEKPQGELWPEFDAKPVDHRKAKKRVIHGRPSLGYFAALDADFQAKGTDKHETPFTAQHHPPILPLSLFVGCSNGADAGKPNGGY